MKNKKIQGEKVPFSYYGRHHLPQPPRTQPTLSSKINRNFYRSLRLKGRTHAQIIRSIQPERKEQFLKDIYYIAEYMDRIPKMKVPKLSWWEKIKRKLISLLILSFFFQLGAKGQTSNLNNVSVISSKKDTLFLVDNNLGCEIMEVWAHYPHNPPVIILKSEKWILTENKKRENYLKDDEKEMD